MCYFCTQLGSNCSGTMWMWLHLTGSVHQSAENSSTDVNDIMCANAANEPVCENETSIFTQWVDDNINQAHIEPKVMKLINDSFHYAYANY